MGGGGAIGTEQLPLDKMLHTPWYGPLPEVPILKELPPFLTIVTPNDIVTRIYMLHCNVIIQLSQVNTIELDLVNFIIRGTFLEINILVLDLAFSSKYFFNKKMMKSRNLIRIGTLIFPKFVLEIILFKKFICFINFLIFLICMYKIVY